MVKVKKSDYWKLVHANDAEAIEEFDREKIKMALIRAGAKKPNIEEIAAKVKPYEGITTDEIDKTVYAELKKRDPKTSKFWKMKRDYKRSRFRK